MLHHMRLDVLQMFGAPGASLQTGVCHSVVFDYMFINEIQSKDCKIVDASPAALRLAPG